MKPIFKNTKICGLIARSVSFGDAKRTIAIFDTRDHLNDEENVDTFTNICYQACKTVKKRATFVYIVLDQIRRATYQAVLDELKPDVIVFAAEEIARLAGVDDLSYRMCGMREDNTVSVIPFRYWAAQDYRGPNSVGNALLGFTLRGLVCAVQGSNLIPDEDKPVVRMRYVDTMSKFSRMMEDLRDAPVIGFDSETTSLAKRTADVISMQFGVKKDDKIISYFLPLVHRETPWSTKEYKGIVAELKEWMLNTDAEFVMHGGSFDCGQLMNLFNVDFLPFTLYDTTAGEFLLDENRKSLRGMFGIPKPYRLDVLERHHGILREQTQIDKEDRSRMASFTLEQIFEYACWDVVTLLIIRNRQISLSTHRLHAYPSKKGYHKTVTRQLGTMLKTFATMQYNGIQIDLNHLVTLARPDGPFQKTIDDIYTNLMLTKEGKKANEIILKNRGAGGGGLFASKGPTRVLQLTKPEHRAILFFDVLKLDPLRHGKNGVGSTDSAFQKAYAGRVPLVELFRQFNSNQKLKTAFADSLLDIVTHDPDFKVDGRVRPGFGFTSVLTGRGNSFEPNAQQVPSRGPLSKVIKKSFIVKRGNVMCAADFSAHEVRMSGIISRDKVICATFKAALEAIRKFRLGPVPNNLEEALEKLEIEIDIHIQNALVFYGKRIHKKDPLRNSIKNVVFSAIYGAMAKKIAKTTESGELQAAVDTIFKKERELAAQKASENPDQDAMVAIKKEISAKREIMERPFEFYLEQAEDAFRRLEEKWHVMFTWMQDTKNEAAKTFVAHYPNGRVRHLWGYLSSDIWSHRAMDRRAVNSVIQGFSADIGIVAANEGSAWCYRNGYQAGVPIDIHLLNIVHDACYRETPFEQIPLAVYLTEHTMSTLPYKFYRDVFDFEFLVPLGYDVDLGLSWDGLDEWKKRPEMLDVMIDSFGEKLKKTTKEIRNVKKDWAMIWDYRQRELEKNKPDLMLLDGERFSSIVPKLHMFNAH